MGQPDKPVAPPAPPVEKAPEPRKATGGGGTTPTPAGTGTGTAAPGGGTGVASPGGGTKRRPRREAPTGDEGGETPGEDTPAPSRKAAVAADDSGGGGAECSITINSIPWAEVWIDGKNTTKHTPVVDFKVPCGKHKIAFKRTDMQIDQTESFSVKPGQNFKQRYTLATDD